MPKGVAKAVRFKGSPLNSHAAWSTRPGRFLTSCNIMTLLVQHLLRVRDFQRQLTGLQDDFLSQFAILHAPQGISLRFSQVKGPGLEASAAWQDTFGLILCQHVAPSNPYQHPGPRKTCPGRRQDPTIHTSSVVLSHTTSWLKRTENGF